MSKLSNDYREIMGQNYYRDFGRHIVNETSIRGSLEVKTVPSFRHEGPRQTRSELHPPESTHDFVVTSLHRSFSDPENHEYFQTVFRNLKRDNEAA